MSVAILPSADKRRSARPHPLPASSDDAFLAQCLANPELRLERSAQGEVLIMPPEGGESGYRGQTVGALLYNWALADGNGLAFGSSTGFRLPDGSIRSPDAAWVRRDRLAMLSAEEKRGFLPLAPDFVIEIRSPTDRLPDLEAKMAAYAAVGVPLGWLIDPESRRVQVYRPQQPPVVMTDIEQIAADPELPGFVLNLIKLWQPDF